MTTATLTQTTRTITRETLASEDWTREELERFIQTLEPVKDSTSRIARLIDAAKAKLLTMTDATDDNEVRELPCGVGGILPDEVIIDGERFIVQRHNDRGVYLSEFEGQRHGITIKRYDQWPALAGMIVAARDRINMRQAAAEANGKTWPMPGPVPTEPPREDVASLIRGLERIKAITPDSAIMADDLTSKLLDLAQADLLPA